MHTLLGGMIDRADDPARRFEAAGPASRLGSGSGGSDASLLRGIRSFLSQNGEMAKLLERQSLVDLSGFSLAEECSLAKLFGVRTCACVPGGSARRFSSTMDARGCTDSRPHADPRRH